MDSTILSIIFVEGVLYEVIPVYFSYLCSIVINFHMIENTFKPLGFARNAITWNHPYPHLTLGLTKKRIRNDPESVAKLAMSGIIDLNLSLQ